MPLPTFVTACPRNCYSTCGLSVEVEDGRVRRIEPLPANRATARGPCLKGLSYVERANAPDRLLHPLRRTRSGFARVSWDEALDLVVDRLVRLRAESGPRSVAYLTGSGTKGLLNGVGLAFWRLYGGCTTTYGDLCWPTGLEATRLTLGDNLHNAPWDLANARLIVLWGRNAAETNLHLMPFVDDARAQGARVVVIDPRRTETAEHADLVIQPRPGSDGALALALAHELIAREWIDKPFVERHVLGFEAYAARVAAWPLERAAALAGVPLESLRTLAEWLGTVKPATLAPGFGMQRYTNSGQTMRALLALVALTGNLGRPGAGWMYANLATQLFDAVRDPLTFYPPEHDDDPVRVSLSIARLGRDLAAQRDPAVRMAWVERGNPVTQCPDSNAVLAAFRGLEFRVVVEEFLTDTAREADLVLPAKNLFEQTDVIGAYWHPYLQLRRKLVEPPGEVRPESAVYRELARRLGVPDARLEGVLPADDAAVEAFLAARLARFPGLTLERLREGPVLAPGAPEVAFADLRFPTPSGRIELESAEAARRWGVDALPDFHAPEESALQGAPLARRFPLQLLTPNTKDRIHSQFGRLRSIRAVGGARAWVALAPADAAARGVRAGDPVEVFNERGALRLAARIDHGLRPGCAVIANGWWEDEGGSVNRLSLGRETDLGHGAAFHDVLVEVRRLPRDAAGGRA